MGISNSSLSTIDLDPDMDRRQTLKFHLDFDKTLQYQRQYTLKNVTYDIVFDTSVRTKILKSSIVDNCSICVKSINKCCEDCEKGSVINYNEFADYLIENKIDLIATAQGTTLDVLPKDILRLINDMIPIEKIIEIKCSISQGKCGHVFHTHCIDKWKGECALCYQHWKIQNSDLYYSCTISKVL